MQQRGEVIVGAQVAAERHAEARHVRLLLGDGLGRVQQVVPVPGVGVLEAQLLGDVHAHQQEMRLVMRGDDVLLALPGAPVFPLHAVDETALADLVDQVVDRQQQAFGHQLHGDRRLDADQRRRPAGGEVGHQLDVDAVPRDRLDLELEARRVLLRPLVHGRDRDAAVGAGLAPYAHRCRSWCSARGPGRSRSPSPGRSRPCRPALAAGRWSRQRDARSVPSSRHFSLVVLRLVVLWAPWLSQRRMSRGPSIVLTAHERECKLVGSVPALGPAGRRYRICGVPGVATRMR